MIDIKHPTYKHGAPILINDVIAYYSPAYESIRVARVIKITGSFIGAVVNENRGPVQRITIYRTDRILRLPEGYPVR